MKKKPHHRTTTGEYRIYSPDRDMPFKVVCPEMHLMPERFAHKEDAEDHFKKMKALGYQAVFSFYSCLTLTNKVLDYSSSRFKRKE